MTLSLLDQQLLQRLALELGGSVGRIGSLHGQLVRANERVCDVEKRRMQVGRPLGRNGHGCHDGGVVGRGVAGCIGAGRVLPRILARRQCSQSRRVGRVGEGRAERTARRLAVMAGLLHGRAVNLAQCLQLL